MDKKIQKIRRRRKSLEKKLGALGPLMRGSVVELATTCGRPNCRCARGEKHRKIYFSRSTKGKTNLIYLGQSKAALARQYCDTYKQLLAIVEEMTTINSVLLKADTTIGKDR